MKAISHNFNFRIWFDENAEANEHTIHSLAELLNITPRKMGRLMNNSDEWTVQESMIIAEAFKMDWWDEFVMPLRSKGLKNNITIDDADRIFRDYGERLGRIAQIA